MPLGIQPIHIVIIVLVAFLIFGGSQLPALGRSLGKTFSEFRKGTKEATDGFKEELNNPGNAPAAPAQPASPAPVPPVASSGNFCIQCGAANLPEARFCASCGTKLPVKSA